MNPENYDKKKSYKKKRKSDAFWQSDLLAGRSQKQQCQGPGEGELDPKAQAAQLREISQKKRSSQPWGDMSSDEEQGATRPARFKAAKGKPDDQAAEPAVDLTEDPQAAQLWATYFIEPTDSAGHDEVIYVGTGGQLDPQPSRAEQEMQQAISAQVKALQAAEKAAAQQQ